MIKLYAAEADGFWTSKDDTKFVFKLNDIENDIYINLDIVDKRPNILAKLIINDDLEYDIDLSSFGTKSFNIPKQMLAEGFLEAAIYVEGASSPYELGESNDTRLLGIKISAVSLTE